MDEKIVIGLFGVFLGFILNFVKDIFTARQTRKKEAEYLAIRMICIFESFMDGCAAVVGDDGLYHGQPDEDGYHRVQVKTPELDVELKDVNWKSFSPQLMYEILYFPSLVKEANNFISSKFEYSASPPDFYEGFQERQYQYSNLGLRAAEITQKLRKQYNIPKNHISNWDMVEYMLNEKNKIDKLRLDRAKAHEKMITSLHTSQFSRPLTCQLIEALKLKNSWTQKNEHSRALKIMLCSQHHGISRLGVMPLEYANRIIFKRITGSYAGRPPVLPSLLYSSSNGVKSRRSDIR